MTVETSVSTWNTLLLSSTQQEIGLVILFDIKFCKRVQILSCNVCYLQIIDIKPFSMSTTIAASERNFSTMRCGHTKLRNRLSFKTVEKLVFFKTNLSTFHYQNNWTDDFDDKACNSDRCIHFQWVLTKSIWLGYYSGRYWSFVCQTIINRRLIIKEITMKFSFFNALHAKPRSSKIEF